MPTCRRVMVLNRTTPLLALAHLGERLGFKSTSARLEFKSTYALLHRSMAKVVHTAILIKLARLGPYVANWRDAAAAYFVCTL